MKANLEKALASATLGTEICKNLMSLQPGNCRLTMVKTEIRSLVERMAAVLESIALQTVKIKVIVPAAPVWLAADGQRLQQALLNLGINALQAMPDGGDLTISVSALESCQSPGAKPEKHICISIADTGTGIAQADLDKLFSGNFTTKTNGNGIGLPTVKKIAEEHGGRCEVNSEPGRGSEFKLLFPLIISSGIRNGNDGNKIHSARPSPFKGGKPWRQKAKKDSPCAS